MKVKFHLDQLVDFHIKLDRLYSPCSIGDKSTILYYIIIIGVNSNIIKYQ